MMHEVVEQIRKPYYKMMKEQKKQAKYDRK